MPEVRVDFSDDELVFSLPSTVSRLAANDITLIDFCQMDDPIHQGDEEFHIVHGRYSFWIVGPFVAGALAALRALRCSHPSIPTRRILIHRLPRKLRSPGFLGLRLFPVAGLGEFPVAEFPPFSALEPSSGATDTL